MNQEDDRGKEQAPFFAPIGSTAGEVLRRIERRLQSELGFE